MATVSTKVCDLYGENDAETIAYAYNGVWYEIDLGEKAQNEYTAFMDRLVAVSREMEFEEPKRRRGVTKSANDDVKDVRWYAISQGWDVPERGRLRQELWTEWEAAGKPRRPADGETSTEPEPAPKKRTRAKATA